MSKIKAILFDLDGVLIDAKEWHYKALNKALGLFGQEISQYDHLVTYDGLPTSKKLHMLSTERDLPRKLHKFIYTMKQQYTQEIIHARCKPLFSHEFALSKLKKEGYRMACCSNAIRESVSLMLTKANLLQFMEFCVSNQDVKNNKPDPEIYNGTIARMGLTPDDCLILEDNEHGIKAAIASGAHLLRINVVGDVNYQNIKNRIKSIEEEGL